MLMENIFSWDRFLALQTLGVIVTLEIQENVCRRLHALLGEQPREDPSLPPAPSPDLPQEPCPVPLAIEDAAAENVGKLWK